MATTLTRRGQAVLAAVLLGAVFGYAFGGRSLNAVVVPAAALLAATRLYVWSFPEPDIERITPRGATRATAAASNCTSTPTGRTPPP